jgi:hypothetical protein
LRRADALFLVNRFSPADDALLSISNDGVSQAQLSRQPTYWLTMWPLRNSVDQSCAPEYTSDTKPIEISGLKSETRIIVTK